MEPDKEQLTIVKKEMGITHQDFYDELANLLTGIPYHHSNDIIRFQINHKKIEIILGPEGIRELGKSMQLPVTPVTLRFFEFAEEEVDDFIKHFNLKFMKGGG